METTQTPQESTAGRSSAPKQAELLIQPGSGIKPLLDGIDGAKHTIQIVIFRFDRGEVETALTRAARRGVFVHALVAYKSDGQGGERTLRELEMRLLADGISVARTATDLVRYHDKLMIVDEETLYLLGFNYTYIDTERSRSFGLKTKDTEWVKEAVALFTADATRQPYTPNCDTFLVSPGNSRQKLTEFISDAKKQLLIYDGKLTDPDMVRLIQQKAKSGVEVRVIGALSKGTAGIAVAPCPIRLHAQTVVRDGTAMFLGSQSLRTLELDARREVGVLIDNPAIIAQVAATFEADWGKSKHAKPLPTITAELNALVADLEADTAQEPGAPPAVDQVLSVKEAVKEAIKEAVLSVVHEPAETKMLKTAVKEAVKEAVHEVTASLPTNS